MNKIDEVEAYIEKNSPRITARLLRQPEMLRRVIEDHVDKGLIASPQSILEIGTHLGATTMRLAAWFPKAEVDTVNINHQEAKEAQRNFEMVSLSDQITQHVADSEIAMKLFVNEDLKYDLIIIDGLHTAEKVQIETVFADLLVPDTNALVIYDDTDRVDYELDFKYDGSYKNFSWKLFKK